MIFQSIIKVLSTVFMIVLLSACQSVEKNTKLIAGTFNTATSIQMKMLDRFAPPDVIVHNNIPYQASPELNVDIYQPQNIEQLNTVPTVVWIHGGGWVSGSKEHARGYFKLLANQGFNVVSVEYQFAPEAIYPTQLQQVDHALNFLQLNAAQYHINPNQLYLAGDSAGANIASHYAALLTNPAFAQASNFKPSIQPKQLKGLILHCGIYDLYRFVNTAPEELRFIEWGVYNLVQAYTGERKEDAAFLKSISTSEHITSQYPPVFISGGNKDFLTKSQSLPFVEVLKQHQVAVTEAFYPDSKEFLVHEYQFMMSKKASQITFDRTIDFIKQTSRPTETK